MSADPVRGLMRAAMNRMERAEYGLRQITSFTSHSDRQKAEVEYQAASAGLQFARAQMELAEADERDRHRSRMAADANAAYPADGGSSAHSHTLSDGAMERDESIVTSLALVTLFIMILSALVMKAGVPEDPALVLSGIASAAFFKWLRRTWAFMASVAFSGLYCLSMFAK